MTAMVLRKHSKADLLVVLHHLQWFYPSSMRLTTYIDLRTDKISRVEAEAEVKSIKAYNGREARRFA